MKINRKTAVIPAIILYITILFLSCNMKSKYISDFQFFIDKVEKNYTTYNKADWDKIDKDFKVLAITRYRKYKEELTPSEKMQINKCKAKYMSFRAYAVKTGIVKDFDNYFYELMQGVGGFFDPVTE